MAVSLLVLVLILIKLVFVSSISVTAALVLLFLLMAALHLAAPERGSVGREERRQRLKRFLRAVLLDKRYLGVDCRPCGDEMASESRDVTELPAEQQHSMGTY